MLVWRQEYLRPPHHASVLYPQCFEGGGVSEIHAATTANGRHPWPALPSIGLLLIPHLSWIEFRRAEHFNEERHSKRPAVVQANIVAAFPARLSPRRAIAPVYARPVGQPSPHISDPGFLAWANRVAIAVVMQRLNPARRNIPTTEYLSSSRSHHSDYSDLAYRQNPEHRGPEIQGCCKTERMLPAGSLNQAIGGPGPRATPFSSCSKPS